MIEIKKRRGERRITTKANDRQVEQNGNEFLARFTIPCEWHACGKQVDTKVGLWNHHSHVSSLKRKRIPRVPTEWPEFPSPLPSSHHRCATTLRYSLLWYRHKDTRRHQGFVKESYFIFVSLLISNMEYYKWRLHKLVKSTFLKNLHYFFVSTLFTIIGFPCQNVQRDLQVIGINFASCESKLSLKFFQFSPSPFYNFPWTFLSTLPKISSLTTRHTHEAIKSRVSAPRYLNITPPGSHRNDSPAPGFRPPNKPTPLAGDPRISIPKKLTDPLFLRDKRGEDKWWD